MSITTQQIADLRSDIGDNGSPPAFSDTEITRIWDRLVGAQSDTQHHEAALGLMARQLLSNGTRLHDYAAGESEEKLDQVFKHFQQLYEMYRPALEAALGQKKQIVTSKVRPVPRQGRMLPAEDATARRIRAGTWAPDEEF